MTDSTGGPLTLQNTPRIAIFARTLRSGGVERVTVNLANEMVRRGITVDLVLAECKGAYLELLDTRVRQVDLNALALRNYTRQLARYLKEARPDALLAQSAECGAAAVVARFLARVQTRVVATCHGTLSRAVANALDFKVRFLPWLMRLTYPHADAIVAVSTGVADDLSSTLGLARDRISVVYNPSVTAELMAFRSDLPEHRFWQTGKPVIVAVGRMVLAKNFPCLIDAFSKALQKQDMRLLIVGDGPERGRLEQQVEQLGLGDYIDMPGFVDPPWPLMAHSSVFVLSSSWEGLPTVLIEALALGCRIVSTDCQSGPSEILEQGRLGELVPIDDPASLADAIVSALSKPHDPQVQKERARDFMPGPSTDAYLSLLLPKVDYRTFDS